MTEPVGHSELQRWAIAYVERERALRQADAARRRLEDAQTGAETYVLEHGPTEVELLTGARYEARMIRPEVGLVLHRVGRYDRSGASELKPDPAPGSVSASDQRIPGGRNER